MKTAIFIEDGTTQVVLTPESEVEGNALSLLKNQDIDVKIFEGSFYDCRGGWVRQREYYSNGFSLGSSQNEHSIIIVARSKSETKPPFDMSDDIEDGKFPLAP